KASWAFNESPVSVDSASRGSSPRRTRITAFRRMGGQLAKAATSELESSVGRTSAIRSRISRSLYCDVINPTLRVMDPARSRLSKVRDADTEQPESCQE